MIRTRFQIMLLAVIVLTVYYPSVFADFCVIDDVEMMEIYRQTNDWSLKSIFVPGMTGGLYYRPMIVSSFVIDKYLLGLDPGLMHIENILIHLVNVLLIFYIAAYLTSAKEDKPTHLPFLIAFFVAVHPLNTESVNWISARTDLLSGMFVLMSTACLLNYRRFQAKKYLVLALAAFVLGILTKEVALAFLPGMVLILSAHAEESERILQKNTNSLSRRFRYIMVVLFCVITALFYFLMRSFAFTSNYSKIGLTLKIMMNDVWHSLFVFLRAFGFYVKKIFIPYPLNFAIMGADPLYELFAMPVVVACVYIMWRRTLLSAMFIAGVFLITPSFVIAFNQIAWTQYAERYLYLPAAFISPAVIIYLYRNLDFQYEILRKGFITVILLVMTFTTFQRNTIWQSNFALVKDTVEKSPESKDMHLVYAGMLAEKGEYQTALHHIEKADAISRIGYDEKSDLIKAYVTYKRGEIDRAIAIYENVLRRTEGKSLYALQNLASIYQEEIPKRSGRSQQIEIHKFIRYSTDLYDRTRDPFILYNIASISKRNGQTTNALKYYQLAHDALKDGNQYRRFAQQEIDRLKKIL